eukprot:TRINITY_DN33546_c0_g1_i1.p1 TRINITY_DN33546_c0_g1~~TRINITY_DN33546_c0_g1_i1.p1  ORF type:complete len:419 (+),score=66.61 TRINITY_DN33546_c0_g1_i1:37-1257(+)
MSCRDGCFGGVKLLTSSPKSIVSVKSPSSKPSTPGSCRSRAESLADDEYKLTKAQLDLLQDMRRILGPEAANVHSSDLLRFLRARRWNVKDAVEQFQATQRWRLEQNAAKWRKEALGPFDASCKAATQHNVLCPQGVEYFPQLRLSLPLSDEAARFYFGQSLYAGFDKEGRPLYLQRVALAGRRFHEMVKHFGTGFRQSVLEGYIRAQEVQAARMEESSARLGRRITQQVVIMDLEALSFWPDATQIRVFGDLLLTAQRYFPETLAMHFFINTPKIFLALWSIFRSRLDARTVAKFQLLGTDYASTLLQHIDANELPREFGGTNSFEGFRCQDRAACERFFQKYIAAANALPGRLEDQSSESTQPRFEDSECTDLGPFRSLGTEGWNLLVLVAIVLAFFCRWPLPA